MRILVFCYEFPPIGGGAGNALHHLAREWAQKGMTVTVVTSRFGALPPEEEIWGIRVIRLTSGRKALSRGRLGEMMLYTLQSFLYARSLPPKDLPDMSIAFMTLPGGLAPLWLKLKRHVPYCVELRGGDVPGFDPERLKVLHFLTKGLIRLIWRKSSLMIANGTGLAELAQRTLTKTTISIPNGVDSGRFTPAERRPAGVFRLLYVGRFAESQKNISFLIHALNFLVGAELVLVGDGPDKARYQNKVRRLGLEDRVRFVEWIKEEALLDAYRGADLYVSASHWEGVPNAVLEAMACGLPCLLSDIPGHRELIEENKGGLLFNASDRMSFINHARALSSDTGLLQRMSRTARAEIQKRFSWDTSADRRLCLYGDLIVKHVKA